MLRLVLLVVLHIMGVVNHTMEGQKREAHTFSLEKASPNLPFLPFLPMTISEAYIQQPNSLCKNPKQNGDLQTRWKFIAPRGVPS